jgi:hypothetical protein
MITLKPRQQETAMGISAVNGSTYTPPAPKAQRVDTQRALELHQQNQPRAVERNSNSNSYSNSNSTSTAVTATEQRRDAAPQKDKGSRVDVRV